MNPIARYLSAVLVAYLVFLVGTLPASHAYSLFKGGLGNLHLYGLEGSVWSGRAAQADFGQHRLGSLQWELLARKLLLGRLELSWHSEGETSKSFGTIARKLTGAVWVRGIEGHLPIADLPSLPNLGPLKPQGVLGVDLQDISIKKGIITSGRGRMVWHGAGFSAPQPVALGDFEMNLSSDASGVKGVLHDTGGPLQAQGTLLLKPDGGYQFTGTLAARNAQLAEGLKFLGTPGPNGAISVAWSGVYAGEPAAAAKPKP
jgi:hypothetical protein